MVEGTPLHFAVPGKELEILQKLLYTYGGVGNEGGTLAPAAAPAAGLIASRRLPARLVYELREGPATLDRVPPGVAQLVRY